MSYPLVRESCTGDVAGLAESESGCEDESCTEVGLQSADDEPADDTDVVDTQ